MSKRQTRTYNFNDIMVNLFNADETYLNDYIGMIKNNNLDGKLLMAEDADALDAFEKLFRDSGKISTVDLFMSYYPSYRLVSEVKTTDLLGMIRIYIKQRKNVVAATDLTRVANKLASEGLTPEIAEAIADIVKSDAVDIKYENIKNKIADKYKRTVDNSGIKTGIATIDEQIGGLKSGQLSTVAGFTGCGKTMTSVCLMYSALQQGFNVCYLSLELSADHLMYNLISRHSLDWKFTKKIEHRDLKFKALSNEDWNYVENTILPDLDKLPGKHYILDEQDIEAYNYFSFDNKLQEIENLCIEETGKGLDLIIVDHIQMLAFSDQGSRLSENTVINRWCNYFRSNCLDFLKSKRQIHITMVAQINREGYKKAIRNGGMYSLTALKEANEIETASSVILGIYSDPTWIASNEVKIGIMKNRDGGRSDEAYNCPAHFAFQLVGGDGPTLETTMAKANFGDFEDMTNYIDNFGRDLDSALNGNGLGIDYVDPVTFGE